MIHEHYVYAQGISAYPSVEVAEFVDLCQRWGILGKTGLSLADIDRLFHQVNYAEVEGKQVDLGRVPGKELYRYEFFEILTRIAKELNPDKTIINI